MRAFHLGLLALLACSAIDAFKIDCGGTDQFEIEVTPLENYDDITEGYPFVSEPPKFKIHSGVEVQTAYRLAKLNSMRTGQLFTAKSAANEWQILSSKTDENYFAAICDNAGAGDKKIRLVKDPRDPNALTFECSDDYDSVPSCSAGAILRFENGDWGCSSDNDWYTLACGADAGANIPLWNSTSEQLTCGSIVANTEWDTEVNGTCISTGLNEIFWHNGDGDSAAGLYCHRQEGGFINLRNGQPLTEVSAADAIEPCDDSSTDTEVLVINKARQNKHRSVRCDDRDDAKLPYVDLSGCSVDFPWPKKQPNGEWACTDSFYKGGLTKPMNAKRDVERTKIANTIYLSAAVNDFGRRFAAQKNSKLVRYQSGFPAPLGWTMPDDGKIVGFQVGFRPGPPLAGVEMCKQAASNGIVEPCRVWIHPEINGVSKPGILFQTSHLYSSGFFWKKQLGLQYAFEDKDVVSLNVTSTTDFPTGVQLIIDVYVALWA